MSRPGNVVEAAHAADELAAMAEEIERLRHAVSARDNFLAVAAHELRNPMTPILGRVTLLRRMIERDGLDLAEVAARLESLEAAIGAFMKRATTLLDVSRIASDRLQVQRVPVNVTDVAARIAENLLPAAVHAGAAVVVLPPEGGDIVALADPLAVEQVIENLVINAIKYGDGSPIRIAAAARPGEKTATIAVQDDGPGIAPEKQARIFERFERAVIAGTTTTGYGVGLWLVRNLCEAMDGAIEIRSAPGRGSTFIVSLPLHS